MPNNFKYVKIDMETPFYFRILMSNMEAKIKTAMLVEMKLMNKVKIKNPNSEDVL